MRAKINLILLGFLIATLGMVYYSCDNPASGDPLYKGIIQGWVYEDSTRIPLPGVKVWADGIPDTLYTNDSGRFHYTKINMPRGEFIYYLIFQKSGYIDKSYSILIKSDREGRIDSLFLRKVIAK